MEKTIYYDNKGNKINEEEAKRKEKAYPEGEWTLTDKGTNFRLYKYADYSDWETMVGIIMLKKITWEKS